MKSSNNLSKIKELLLKSGMPLEVSVAKKIVELGIEDRGEIGYRREEKAFFTDILSRKNFNILENLCLSVNFIIECKYKTREHSWYFMKYPTKFHSYIIDHRHTRTDIYNMSYFDAFERTLSIMGYDIYNMKNFPLSEKYFDAENLFDFEIADKGVDILKNSFDPNIIKRAVYQAIFASIKVQCKSMLDNNLRYDMIEHNPKLFYSRNNKREIPIGSLTIPMVVTTAKIFKVRDNVTLEELEKEKDIRNLLEEKQGILLPYANYLDRKEFQKELISTDPTISSKSIKISEIEDFCSPNCVYIVNYEHLEKVFSNCIAKIESLCENYAKVFQKELKSKS